MLPLAEEVAGAAQRQILLGDGKARRWFYKVP